LAPGCGQPPPIITPSPEPPTPVPARPEPEPVPQQPGPTEVTVLKFYTISKYNSFIESYPKAPRMELITSKTDFPIKGISTEDQNRINAVDFTGNFVLIAFHGWTYPGNGIEIQKITQIAEHFWVRARFQEPGEAAGTSVTTPYHIVRVSKEQMTQFGEIEFRLSDGFMKKDFITGVITSFPPQPGAPEAATLPPGNDLIFDALARSDFPDAGEGHGSPGIQIITSKPVSTLTGINPWDQIRIEDVDFSNYFVVIAFIGHSTPAFNIKIRRVWQDKDVVYLLFHARPPRVYTQPMTIFPYYIVQVSKRQMPQHGKITFKLLDQYGKELVTTTHEIPK